LIALIVHTLYPPHPGIGCEQFEICWSFKILNPELVLAVHEYPVVTFSAFFTCIVSPILTVIVSSVTKLLAPLIRVIILLVSDCNLSTYSV